MVTPINPSMPLDPKESPQVSNEIQQLQWATALVGMYVSATEKNYDPEITNIKSALKDKSSSKDAGDSFNSLIFQINSGEKNIQFPTFNISKMNDPVESLMFTIRMSTSLISVLGEKGMVDPMVVKNFNEKSDALIKNLSPSTLEQTAGVFANIYNMTYNETVLPLNLADDPKAMKLHFHMTHIQK